MHDLESKLSAYIDALNEEQEPERRYGAADNAELEKLLATARLVRTLREPALPDAGFPERLSKSAVHDQRAGEHHSNQVRGRGGRRRIWLPAAALAAGLCLFAVFANWSGLFNRDLAYAMEKAVAGLSSYHGVLEMRSQNSAGEEWLSRQSELWSEGDKYAVKQEDGTLTVNNTEQKWQVRPQTKEVALLPLVPDPTRLGFDLRDEAKAAKKYPHEVVGNEVVAGRQTSKLKIAPPGGLAYYLWVDSETNLPIQLQTAMQNGLQTTYTLAGLETNTPIDSGIFTYQPPAGYRVVAENPGQLVATIEEAAAICGITPLLPSKAPARIFAFKDHIALDYGDTSITEKRAQGTFQPAANAALGTAANGPLEIWWERLRWRQGGLEIEIEGTRRVELARQIAADLTLPDIGKGLVSAAQVKVPVDMEIIRADQRQVDAGHVPWQLDPLQVSLTFVNLQVSPGGIVGEPQIPEASFKLTANSGAEAVVAVSSGPVKQVYLQRLVRQDETGIWSVVGYDPR